MQEDVRQQVGYPWQKLGQNLGVITDIFMPGKGIEYATHGVNLQGYLPGGTALGSLEEQVLNKMGHTVIFR